MIDDRRRLHALVPDARRRRVLVDRDDPPARPTLDLRLAHGQSTAAGTASALCERLAGLPSTESTG